jgi:sugar lactone lactonase YvrE
MLLPEEEYLNFRVVLGTLALFPCGASSTHGQQYVVTSVAGSALPPAPSLALSSFVATPVSVAVHHSGRVFFSAYNCVFSFDAKGTLVRVAGRSQLVDYSGDGGPATLAALAGPSQIAVAPSGDVYIADTYNNRVRKVDDSGNITTVVGSGAYGYAGDGGPALGAELAYPQGVALDSVGNLYISDSVNQRIRKVGSDGTITTVAGTGVEGYLGDGGPALRAQLNYPAGIAVDAWGNIFFADYTRIRKVSPDGTITTVAGSDAYGFSGDGGPAASAILNFPVGIAVDNLGNLYIADTYNSVIRRVTPDGTISTVAGGAVSPFTLGDGGPATDAFLWEPFGVATDFSGNLFIADTNNNRIRKVNAHGIITTAAGTDACCAWGDDGPAIASGLNNPGGITLDHSGDLYIADNLDHRIRKITSDGLIATIAGVGLPGYGGDGGAATLAKLDQPLGVALGRDGSLYIADADNHRVRKITPQGTIQTSAGNGIQGFSGDGGPAINGQLDGPTQVAVADSGAYYILDGERIRRVGTDGSISTFAENLQAGDMAIDAAGDVFLAASSRILKVTSDGAITTVAGTGEEGYSGDGSPATSASLCWADGVALDGAGNLYIADAGNNRIRKVSADGIISTIAGTSEYGYSGDGGTATDAQLHDPGNMAVDALGDVYLVDNGAIRLLVPEHTRAVLSASLTNQHSFLAGEVGATYQIVVSNIKNAGPTVGMVTAREVMPRGLVLVSVSGEGWSCTGPICTRGDTLDGGISYPPLTVIANVASDSGPEVTNHVMVTGGGSPATAALNVTRIGSLIASSPRDPRRSRRRPRD